MRLNDAQPNVACVDITRDEMSYESNCRATKLPRRNNGIPCSRHPDQLSSLPSHVSTATLLNTTVIKAAVVVPINCSGRLWPTSLLLYSVPKENGHFGRPVFVGRCASPTNDP
ncbi:unnamed protein product [Macrosiphum euphorbiae]|uniref:Uncharacterized protein n=1 Tax=Macrosiphum euphorbiae TaxID=13131 RepID=A0AAV0WGS9_9HEMI|nr:unnamed protein product [Macrosiphum euphorbiae]